MLSDKIYNMPYAMTYNTAFNTTYSTLCDTIYMLHVTYYQTM